MLLDVRSDHLKIVQEILKKFVSDREVWAFGSRAKWLAKEYSDLDLCVVGDTPLSFRTLGLIEEAFDESDLPYKVDVVDWATTSESFRKIIEREKVGVQEGKSLGGVSEWLWTSMDEAFNVNPSRPLKRGAISPFIPMDVLPLYERAVERIESREYNGTGMRFCNGDTLIAKGTETTVGFKFAARSGSALVGANTSDGTLFAQSVYDTFR